MKNHTSANSNAHLAFLRLQESGAAYLHLSGEVSTLRTFTWKNDPNNIVATLEWIDLDGGDLRSEDFTEKAFEKVSFEDGMISGLISVNGYELEANPLGVYSLQPIKVAVFVSGGVVNEVRADRPVEVEILDFDSPENLPVTGDKDLDSFYKEKRDEYPFS
jgi:hypothetical protein